MSKVLKFLREVVAEFKNITWPKRDALINLTIVVISFSVIVSLILGGFDYLFTNSFALLGQLKTQPTQNQVAPNNLNSLLSPSATPSANSLIPSINISPGVTIKISPLPTK
jgi:preprotein translocase subunit SecE